MKKVNLLEDSIGSLGIRYIVPSVLGMVGLSMCIFFDTMFIGRGVGNTGLAALNVAIPLYAVLNSIGYIFGVGGATVLSISIGKGLKNKGDGFFTFSVIGSAIVGGILCVLALIFLERFAYLLGGREETIPFVMEYLKVILTFGVAFIVIQVLCVYIRNDKNPKLVMWAVIAANITNICLDYVFIFPMDLGMFGAALATSVAQFVGLGILCFHFIFKKNSIHLKFTALKEGLKHGRRILINGVPSLVNELSAGMAIFIFNIVIVRISGVKGVSAYSIISNVALIFLAIFNGIAQGLQPIISTNYGGGKKERVLKSYALGRNMCFILGATFFLVGFIFPKEIAGIFSKDLAGIIDITIVGIRLYFIAFLVMGVNILIVGFMQAIEKSKISTYISLTRGFILLTLVITIMAYCFKLIGVWLTVPIVEGITFIYSQRLLKRDKELYLK